MSRNCWEVMGCEKYPGGARVDERGPCPASYAVIATGINSGLFAGRACWAVENTLCTEKKFPSKYKGEKLEQCHRCYFYALVAVEEGEDFWTTEQIQQELHSYHRY